MSNTITNIKQAISLDLTTALRRVADAHNITDVDLLAQELLVHLGVVDRVSAPAQPKAVKAKASPAPEAEPEADGESEGTKEKKARTRTVSAKQKKDFMALEGATEENLKSIIKGYKDATQEQIDALMTTDSKENAFILYARVILKPGGCAGPPDVVAEKKAKAPAKAKKDKGRVSWNATETKIFKKIVESAGSVISDELKQEFADYVSGKTEDEFAVVALEGHMRAFVDSKKVVVANGGAGKAPEDDNESLAEFEFNDETLLKGSVSGKIYRATTEAGDVQVGVCGQGIFKDIKV
jgi:Fe-S cluster assembly iron-binding protein IscA